MQNLKQLIVRNWRPLALYGGMFVLLGALLFWRIGSLLPGFSHDEVATYHAGTSFRHMLDNPLFAPFLAIERLLFFLKPDSLLVPRMVAASCGLLVLGLCCWLLRAWYGTRTAIIGTVLLGTSAWFLHVSRFGGTEVAFFGAFALFALGYWFRQSQSAGALTACFVAIAVLLYVPGMIWFVAAGLIWQWRTVDAIFKKHLLTVSGGTLALLIALVPLGWGLYDHRSLIMPWLGLPTTWPMPWDVIGNILHIPYHLIIANEANPMMWLGTAPVLDIASVVLLAAGVVVTARRIRLVRTRVLFTVIAVGVLLIGLGSGSLSLILPFLYILIAAGAGHILDQWLRVFPRNPIARGLGVTMVGCLLLLVIGFHIRHYFIGFPQASKTYEIYTITRP